MGNVCCGKKGHAYHEPETSQLVPKEPPLCPPSKTKARLIPSTDLFRDVDTKVNKVPPSSCRNVSTLATTLIQGCPDDLHKVRAFYCWIAANISYDVEAMSRRDVKSQEVDAVLRTRRAVCQGYSRLFQALCKEVDIPCQIVSGLDKVMNYDPGTIFTDKTESTHAWNIVFVKGEWRPLDVTWGSGHLDENRIFQRKFVELWFLTDPNVFVTSHFPLLDGNIEQSKKYQLLKRPISAQQFSDVISLKSTAHEIGLKCVTHKNVIIEVRRDVTIILKASKIPLETVRVTLKQRGSNTANSTNVLTSLNVDGTCKIYVRPPRADTTYELDVRGRGRDQGKNNTVYQMLTYIIKCTEAHPTQERYPDKAGPWGVHLDQPNESGLKLVNNAPWSFRADKHNKVKIQLSLTRPTQVTAKLFHADNKNQTLGQYTMVECDDHAATLTARLLKPGFYNLEVYAGDLNQNSLPHCADYLLHADKEITSCVPFPEVLRFAHEQKVRLITPQTLVVPRGKRTLFKLHAPSLGRVMVSDMEMVRKKGVWEAEFTPARGMKKVQIYGAVDPKATTLSPLYQFNVE